MDRILCEDSDSEQWRPVWEDGESTPGEKEAWEIAHDFVPEEYPEEFKFSENRRNSDPSFRNWEKRQRIKEKAFEQVKEKFAEEPILTNHNPELEGIVEADASDQGMEDIFGGSQTPGPGLYRSQKFVIFHHD